MYYHRWDSFMELLTEFSNKCPTYLETIWDELKEGLWCVLMIIIVIHSANSANIGKVIPFHQLRRLLQHLISQL